MLLDSCFYVLKGIVELEKDGGGGYAKALIEKRQYWSRSIPRDNIDEYFLANDVGHCEMLHS